MNYKRKQMVCDLDKPEEKELWDFLQTLGHGRFSNESKAYWLAVMKIVKEGKSK